MFFALVGVAIWFGRGDRATPPAASAPSEPAPASGASTSSNDTPTGAPASTRERDPLSLFTAAATGQTDVLITLLDATPFATRVHQLDADGWTALHHAAYHDQVACVRLLLEREANPNAEAEHRCTPLHMAAAQGSPAVVELLVEAGASLDHIDDDGATPLHYATLSGRLDLVRALLAAGAHPNVKNARFETPLDLARRLSDPKLVATIEEAGGKPGTDVRMAKLLPDLDETAAARQPRTLYLDAESAPLLEARRKARASLPALLQHLGDQPDAVAAIKFPLRDGDTVEWVWGRIQEVGPPFRVHLDAPPTAVPAPEGPVDVPHDDVVDWQLRLDGERTAGGYTQRAILDALHEEYGFLTPTHRAERDRLVDLPPPATRSER